MQENADSLLLENNPVIVRQKFLKLVDQGAGAWNRWRENNPHTTVDLSNTVFSESVSFEGFRFPADTSFMETVFDNETVFDAVTFEGSVNFNGVIFNGDVRFNESEFVGPAWFKNAIFHEDAEFGEVIFRDDVWFDNAKFSKDALFTETTFEGNGRFCGTWFDGDARFGEATFEQTALFNAATFSKVALFYSATFKQDACFTCTAFGGDAVFNRIACIHDLWFIGANISNDTWFNHAEISGNMHFSKARIQGDAHYTDVQLNGFGWFNGSIFNQSALFSGMKIGTGLDFTEVTFNSPPVFQNTENTKRIVLTGVHVSIWKPSGFFPNAITWITGGWTSNAQVVTELRHLRGIAAGTHASDTDRDLFILERQAELGVFWSTLYSSKFQRSGNNTILKATSQTLMMMLYRWSSNYGRSVSLPLTWIAIATLGFYYLYSCMYIEITGRVLFISVKDALRDFTLSSAMPFGSSLRPTFNESIIFLFGDAGKLPWQFQLALTVQSFWNVVFLFLAGLALRNFFRFR